MSVQAAYLGIILIWSTTPLTIQWSTQGMSFSLAVLARMAIGLATALAIRPRHRRFRLPEEQPIVG